MWYTVRAVFFVFFGTSALFIFFGVVLWWSVLGVQAAWWLKHEQWVEISLNRVPELVRFSLPDEIVLARVVQEVADTLAAALPILTSINPGFLLLCIGATVCLPSMAILWLIRNW